MDSLHSVWCWQSIVVQHFKGYLEIRRMSVVCGLLPENTPQILLRSEPSLQPGAASPTGKGNHLQKLASRWKHEVL